MLRNVAAARMAKRDGGVGVFVFLAKDCRHRFADDVAPSKNDHLRALDRHAGADEQFMHTVRGARHETAALCEHQLADVHRMKAVNVLRR